MIGLGGNFLGMQEIFVVNSKAGGVRFCSLEEQNSLKLTSLQPERNYFYFRDPLWILYMF